MSDSFCSKALTTQAKGASPQCVVVFPYYTSQCDSFFLAVVLAQMETASNMKVEGWFLFLFIFAVQKKFQMMISSSNPQEYTGYRWQHGMIMEWGAKDEERATTDC